MTEKRKRYVVVADDEVRNRIGVGQDLEALGEYVEVKLARNATELFDHARFGRLGDTPDWIEADAVTLDDNYGRDQRNWNIDSTPHKEKVDTKLKESGMSESQRTSVVGFSNSINLAIALRAVGYRGDILVVSYGPPDARMINNATSGLDIRKPVINGTVVKKIMFGQVYYSRLETDPETGDVLEKQKNKDGTRTDAFRDLLDY